MKKVLFTLSCLATFVFASCGSSSAVAEAFENKVFQDVSVSLSFDKKFLSLVEVSNLQQTIDSLNLMVNVLPKDMGDYQIIEHYGRNYVVQSPQEIAKQMVTLMNKNPTTFKNQGYYDGKANSWYFEKDGQLLCVSCYWNYNKWRCSIDKVKENSYWPAGYRIFSSTIGKAQSF